MGCRVHGDHAGLEAAGGGGEDARVGDAHRPDERVVGKWALERGGHVHVQSGSSLAGADRCDDVDHVAVDAMERQGGQREGGVVGGEPSWTVEEDASDLERVAVVVSGRRPGRLLHEDARAKAPERSRAQGGVEHARRDLRCQGLRTRDEPVLLAGEPDEARVQFVHGSEKVGAGATHGWVLHRGGLASRV